MRLFQSSRPGPPHPQGHHQPLSILHCTAVQKFFRKLPNNNKESGGKRSPCCYGGRSRRAPGLRTRKALQWEKIRDTWNQLKAPKACQLLCSPPSPPLHFFFRFISVHSLGYVCRKTSFHMLLWIQKILITLERGAHECRTILLSALIRIFSQINAFNLYNPMNLFVCF